MKVVIASATVPTVEGGGRLIVHWTAEAIRAAGHEVEEVYLPFPMGVRRTLPALVGMRATPLRGAGDRLIAIRWPAHVIRHENKATWFIHHLRGLFDLWDTPHRPVPDNAEGVAYRESIRRIDNLGLAESRALFANSAIVRDRLREFNGVEATPLLPPLGGNVGRFRNDGFGDFVVYPSRVTPIKRQLLAVEALLHTSSAVRLVLAGKPESALYEREIRDFVSRHRLHGRVDLRFDWIAEEEKVDLLSRCLALAYLPFDEDSYGYPSLEASHAGKPIVTVTDAGGALEFVRDGVEGLVAEPTPVSLAAAFDRLHDDRAAAERMGERCSARRGELGIEWERVVPLLLGEDS